MPTGILNTETLILTCWWKGNIINGPLAFHWTYLMYNALDTCSFHNRLKTNPRYLNHNVNRRCDDLIEVLLSVEVDMFYERKRKELLTSTTEASRKVEGDRHTKGQSIVDLKVHTQVIWHSNACWCAYYVCLYIFNGTTGRRKSLPSGFKWFKNTVHCGRTIIHMSRSTELLATLCGKGMLLPVPTHDLLHLLWFPAWSSMQAHPQGVPPPHAAAICEWWWWEWWWWEWWWK